MSHPSVLDTQALQRLLQQVQAQLGEPTALGVDALKELWAQASQALDEGRHEDALPLWEQLVSAQPGEPSFQFGFALALQQLGQIELAAKHFSCAYALDPTDAACAYRIGECLLALGWTADAHDALLAAQQLCDLPQNAPQIRELSLTLMRQMQ